MNIIITGAGKGIGLALLKTFALNSEYKIVAISRNLEKINDFRNNNTSQKFAEIFPVSYDLENENNIFDLIARIKIFLGKVDILINNAGILINKPFLNLTSSDFNQTFNVNVKATFLLSQALIPIFNINAHIINISSMGGFQGSVKYPGLSLYSSSKAAIAVLTECMANELDSLQIKVNCLALGSVQTEMLSNAFPEYNAPLKDYEIAEFIKYFALNGHHYMNGKIIPIALQNP